MAVIKNFRSKDRDGRRLPSNEPRSYEISEMRAIHFRMVELSFLGYKEKAIAQLLNRTPQNVSDVLNSELAQAHLASLQNLRDENSISVAKQLKELAPEALRLVKTSLVRKNEELLKDDEAKLDALHAKIALEVLDRTGHGVPKTQVPLNLHLTRNHITNVKNYNNGNQDEDIQEVKVS